MDGSQKFKDHEQYQEYLYDMGSECCGWDLHHENDNIGICGRCREWAGYYEGCQTEFNEWQKQQTA
jgi:hypothetical protein